MENTFQKNSSLNPSRDPHGSPEENYLQPNISVTVKESPSPTPEEKDKKTL
jgi:hypothetical protein